MLCPHVKNLGSPARNIRISDTSNSRLEESFKSKGQIWQSTTSQQLQIFGCSTYCCLKHIFVKYIAATQCLVNILLLNILLALHIAATHISKNINIAAIHIFEVHTLCTAHSRGSHFVHIAVVHIEALTGGIFQLSNRYSQLIF